mgnify:CR=1 FL=1
MSLEELNSKYNIFTVIKRIKLRDKGKLHGLTFAVKDIIDIMNLPTTAGSRFFRYIPHENSPVIERILDEGGEIVGKTNTHEFAMGATNTSSYLGPARNPIDPERISGGSSGGSAVAVALGIVDVGIGTDTGGSIRIPASLCGVIGFKPTTGLIPTKGVVPFSWTFDTIGFITRDLSTLKRVLESVYDDKTPLIQQAKRKPKLGLFLFGEDEASKALKKVTNKLSGYFDIEEVHNEFITKYAPYVRKAIALAEGVAFHKSKGLYPQRINEYFPDVRQLLINGEKILAYEYVNALRIRNVLIREYIKIFREFDALLSPTTKIPAPKISEVIGRELEYRDVLIGNTEIFNAVNAPSISLPVSTINDLPIGLMVSGEPYADGKVLDIAERILGVVEFIKK